METKILTKTPSYAWVILIITFFAGFAAPANMAKVTTLAPVMMQVFGFDEAGIGLSIAMFYLLGCIFAYPVALILAKLGIKWTVGGALLLGAIGSILGVLTDNITVFMISRFLEGAGLGIMGVAGPSAITPWFHPTRRAFPLGVWAMWVALAMFLCPNVYAAVNASFGWQACWYATLVFDVVILVLWLVLYRTPNFTFEGEEIKQGEEKLNLGRAVRNITLVGLALVFFFDSGAFMAINGFFTTYLTTQINVDLQQAAFIASLAAILGAIFAPIFGFLADTLKTRRWLLVVGLLAGVVFTCWVFNETRVEMYYLIVVIGGICGGGVPSLLWSTAPTVVAPKDQPAAFASLAFTQNLGMAIGAIAAGGVIVAYGYFTTTVFVLAPCYIIGIILLFTLARKVK